VNFASRRGVLESFGSLQGNERTKLLICARFREWGCHMQEKKKKSCCMPDDITFNYLLQVDKEARGSSWGFGEKWMQDQLW
jgi:hypothetical protein